MYSLRLITIIRNISLRLKYNATVPIPFMFSTVARNDPFEGRELGFSRDRLINATNMRPRLFNSSLDHDSKRIGEVTNLCSKENIDITQGQTDPLTNGIPTYTVQIENICLPLTEVDEASCAISNIHLSCEWFSSYRLINPSLFRRIAYNDRLVNDGKPMAPGQTIYFAYANTYAYPMSVSSVSCS